MSRRSITNEVNWFEKSNESVRGASEASEVSECNERWD